MMNTGDISTTIVVIGGIIVYSIFEYQRRELQHRETMELLRHDIVPPPPVIVGPSLWSLIWSAVVCMFLLSASLGMIVLSIRMPGMRMPLIVIALVFAVLLAMASVLLFTDVRRYRRGREAEKGGIS
ncbi:MAG TPA: hypothetical protein VK470_07075 [Bacteroidota bacterium]|nr:hypothetical protein [Bacteroidota bacterium]